GGGGLEPQVRGKNNPVLVPFEDAFAIADSAGGIIEDAHGAAVVKSHAYHTLRDGMAVCAGVAVHGGADRAGNSSQRLQTFESSIDCEIHQVLQYRAGIGGDAG